MTKKQTKKDEIIEIAERLFKEKGYDKASMTDIQIAAGIARGTLYHHFKSKEAILDALIWRLTDQVLTKVTVVVEDKTRTALERFLEFSSSMNLNAVSGINLSDILHQPQNALLHEKSNQVLLEKIAPLLAELVTDGIAEGVFNTPYPYQATELVVIALLHQPLTSVEAVEAFIYHLECLFGAKKGSFNDIYDLL